MDIAGMPTLGEGLTLQSAGAGATPAVVLKGVMPLMVFDLVAPQ
jgi:hypothetical protein